MPKPPSIIKLTPLTNLASSLARNNATFATSSTSGVTALSTVASQKSSSTVFLSVPNASTSIGVATPPGEITFTPIPYSPYSTHKLFTKPVIACFDNSSPLRCPHC
ncbi:hypothetical protein BVRB_7g158480 [Beta vulgaris subsp. vulgaris]|nr:hypothetical protein BVRB_7g158480 [Beta vulgaris subsp. vulgaris]